MKRWPLWSAGVITALLSLHTYLQPPLSTVVALERSTRSPVAGAPANHNEVSVVDGRSEIAKQGFDPFYPKPPEVRPVVVAPPPPAPPPAAKPVPPPLPFKFFGRMVNQDGEEAIYLQHADDLIQVATGQVVESLYRIEKIEAARIVFMYLPLKELVDLPLPVEAPAAMVAQP